MDSEKKRGIRFMSVSLRALWGVCALCGIFLSMLIFFNFTLFKPVMKQIVASHPPLLNMANTAKSLLGQPQTEGQPEEDVELMEKNIEALIDIVSEKIRDLPSESERLDFLRIFVNSHSIHQGGEEYSWDTGRVLSMMYEFYNNETDPPHLTCGSRTLALKAILDKLKIDNRMIMIFGSNASRIVSHTFLEAFNKDTGGWELQDPDKNLYYRNVKTLSRASTMQLVLGDVEAFEPCSPQFGCGWEENKLTSFIENKRFGAVAYDNRPYLKRQIFNRKVYEKTVIIVNTDRFSITKKFPDNKGVNFIQWANKPFRKPVFIFNHQFD